MTVDLPGWVETATSLGEAGQGLEDQHFMSLA